MADYFNIEDKVILITGDSVDLCIQIAEEFALEDAKLAIFSKIEENSKKIVDYIQEEYDIDIIYSVTDFDDEKSVEKSIKKVLDTFDKIDILVNTALRGSNELLIDRLSTRNIYPLFQISRITIDDENVFNIEDKVAVITGASGRIGEEVAQKFANEGASLYLFSDNEESLQESVERYKSFDNEFNYSVTDLADEDIVKESLEKVLNHHGIIDVLVNAAGMGENKTVVDGLVSLGHHPQFCVVWLQQFSNL